MATVKGMYQRGSVWWLRYTVNGKQRRESLETDLEQVAAVKAIQILHRAPLEQGSDFTRELDGYLKDAVEKRKITRDFADARRYVLVKFATEFEINRLSDFTPQVIERWLAELRNRVALGTVEGYYFHARAFGKWLVKQNKIRENPAEKVEMEKVDRAVRKNFLAAETVRMLIDGAPNDEMRFILYCGFHAGMRKLEVVEARPEWFRLGYGGRRGSVTVQKSATFRPKDRDERTIPLSSEFEEFLRRYGLQSPFMIRPNKKHGKHRYRYDFGQAFETYIKSHGVKCCFHDARRTFVSLKLIEDSSLIFKLAKWTGDHVSVLQDHYGHLLADDEDIEVGI